MCSAPDIPDPKPAVRYAQEKRPTTRDVGDAKKRAGMRRRRATSTLLASDVGAVDMSNTKTLLGA